MFSLLEHRFGLLIEAVPTEGCGAVWIEVDSILVKSRVSKIHIGAVGEGRGGVFLLPQGVVATMPKSVLLHVHLLIIVGRRPQ